MKAPRPIVLVTGGARSGKSGFALARGAAMGSPRLFVATAEPRDEEMAVRIARHRAERARGWRTVEAPKRLAAVLRRPGAAVVLIDCLTLWLANVMGDDAARDVTPDVDALIDALALRRASVIAVTNEVGLGIVPENALARTFRDAAGILNQTIAAVADEVEFVVAGLPMKVK